MYDEGLTLIVLLIDIFAIIEFKIYFFSVVLMLLILMEWLENSRVTQFNSRPFQFTPLGEWSLFVTRGGGIKAIIIRPIKNIIVSNIKPQSQNAYGIVQLKHDSTVA